MADILRGERDKLVGFVKKHGNSHSKLMVLFFWARHPKAKFSLDCIANAIDFRRLDLRDAVVALVREGLVDEICDQNGISWYKVSNQGIKYFEVLGDIDWSEVRYLNNSYQQLVPTLA